jgi:uncharacterized protein
MRLMNIVVALTVLLVVAPARAESPSPDTLAAARELVATTKAADNFKAILPTMLQSMKPAIVQGRPAVEKDYDAIMPAMIELATSRLSDVAELVAQVHARNFTASEMHEIQAFYLTPTGQKMVQSMPTIMQQGQEPRRRSARAHHRRITQARP